MDTTSEWISIDRIVTVSRDPEVQRFAQQYGRKVFGADDPADALHVIQTADPNLILIDLRFDVDAVGALIEKAVQSSQNLPVVLIEHPQGSQTDPSPELTQFESVDRIQSLRDDEEFREVIRRIHSASEQYHKPAEQGFYASELAAQISMAGKSSAMLDTLNMVELVASSQCNPVLVLGETGTGKELVARAVHTLRSPNKPFVAINCAALTASLLESELFGHVKGAFTGADRDKTGLLELAGSGTLLLDEISEMPMELQAKLLRVLEEKQFRKVGGTQKIDCEATIIAASNRNLQEEVQNQRFRRDLYYRLNICPITLAPLRFTDRRADIPLLAEYFLRNSKICPNKRDTITSLTTLAIEALEGHTWPGNVRELRNVIDRAIILEKTDKIGLDGIIFDADQICDMPKSNAANRITNFSLAKAERELIALALQQTGWQKTRAATLLGITRATLYAKVKQYNIEKDADPASNPAHQKQPELEPASIS